MFAPASLLLTLALAAAALTAGWRAWQRLRYYLHMMQLESYKPARFAAWFSSRGKSRFFRISHALGLLLLGISLLPIVAGKLAAALGWSVAFASSRHYQGFSVKKPLAFTPRMKRLATAAAGIGIVPVLVGWWAGWDATLGPSVAVYLAGWWVADLLAPLWVLLAAWLMAPVEKAFQNRFKEQARETLRRRTDLQLVAVTGSFGKTSVKFIVAEILRQRFNVLATPGSYNTPMGICLVVNQQLKPDHQILVLEMGMRYRGDIRELCAIASPDVGIVTAVGPAHLETMGSLEAIAEEKGDLLTGLKPAGVAVLNIDDPRVAAMDRRAPGKIWRVSVAGNPTADVTARDITYGPAGVSFIVRDETGAEQAFSSRLLGQHNVLNILLGVAVGRQFGLRLRQIAHAVTRLEPIEHRLQLRSQGVYTVIDDAFNANPVGARHAVEVLGAFKGGRRVIVTPGMVELGVAQESENRRLGEHIATHTDLALLIGRQQTYPIQEGLRSQGFPEENLLLFDAFSDAHAYLDAHMQPGDTVLILNDLPDQYNTR